jgi:5-methylcytosine-specific restriction endonuclease McrA
MAQEWAAPFYNSHAWTKCRNAYYKSKNGMCELCYRPGEIVHHKIPLTPENISDLEITLGFKNLQLLCRECHLRVHGFTAEVVREGLRFDESGNLVEVSSPPCL